MRVAVSGGFDPLHPGHLDLLEAARALGTELVVILNSDEFLIRKKGAAFMPWGQRARILSALRCVDEVVPAIDSDQTVCKSLIQYRPDIFANGGDRVEGNVPEDEVCRVNHIKMVYGVGGGKTESSSDLLSRWKEAKCPQI